MHDKDCIGLLWLYSSGSVRRTAQAVVLYYRSLIQKQITHVLQDLKTWVSEAILRLTTAGSGYHYKDLERPSERGSMYHYGPMCQVLRVGPWKTGIFHGNRLVVEAKPLLEKLVKTETR